MHVCMLVCRYKSPHVWLDSHVWACACSMWKLEANDVGCLLGLLSALDVESGSFTESKVYCFC